MTLKRLRLGLVPFVAAIAALSPTVPARALDTLTIEVTTGNASLTSTLTSASLLKAAQTDGRTDSRDILAAALAEYARMVSTLYAQGYYSGTVHVLVDGREAALMQAFAAPERIDNVRVIVDPGPAFTFGEARIAPLAPGTTPIEAFATGQRARSTVVQDALDTAVSDWRDAGYPKTALAGQSARADHRDATLDATITLDPGAKATFGTMTIATPSAVRDSRIRRIAGFPTGETFSPALLEKAAQRLRQTGAFSSVVMTEGDEVNPDGTLDVALTLADQRPRRFGVGAEYSSVDGLSLTGFWMHRNLFRGAERLRFDAEISNITGELNALDYSLSLRLDVPALLGPRTSGYIQTTAEYLDEPSYTSASGGTEFGLTRVISDTLTVSGGIGYLYAHTDDSQGTRDFSILSLPLSGTWDRRDDTLNTTSGSYLMAELMPFQNFGDGTGVRATVDARQFFPIGEKLVLAGRLQAGIVAGLPAEDVYAEYLFYAGGSGTVRGHPYQSLSFDTGGGETIGGKTLLAGSIEARYEIGKKLGIVGFVDVANLGAETFFDDGDAWQTGAGLGVRYNTGVGPIRLDLAMPVTGDTGNGMQLYIGIGQAF